MESFSFGEFMHEGGKGTWLALLLGLGNLAAAIRYAVRPERGYFRFMAALWLTLLVAVVHATVIDLAAVFHYLEDPVRAPEGQVARLFISGIKESTRPAILGGIFLTLVPLLAAVGIYREGTPRAAASP